MPRRPQSLTWTPEFNVALFAFLLNLRWELWQVPLFEHMPLAPHREAGKTCSKAAAGDAAIRQAHSNSPARLTFDGVAKTAILWSAICRKRRCALLGAELQRRGQRQGVHGPRVAVQVSGFGVAQALKLAQSCNLTCVQRLDGTLLPAGVRAGLRASARRHRHGQAQDRKRPELLDQLRHVQPLVWQNTGIQWPEWPPAGLRTWTSTALAGLAIDGMDPGPGPVSALKRAGSAKAPVNS